MNEDVAENANMDPLPPRARWGLWIELAVVLLLAWLPWLTWSLLTPNLIFSADTLQGIADIPTAPPEDATRVDDLKYILQESIEITALLQILGPMCLILWWRRREFKLSEYGIVRPRFLRDAGGGFLLFLLCGFIWISTAWLPQEEYPDIFFYPSGLPGYLVMVVALSLNSIVEELVWRGYMLHRLTLLTGSKTFAILASSFLFASYHLYQGASSAISIFVWGVAFAIVFRWFRSLWPLIIGHTLNNIVTFVGPGFE